MWNKPICRHFNYYVDPESTEIIELGTKAYPFKNIALPFVEILNYFSHSDKNITVFVKEYTNNMLLWESSYIVNITMVTVETYTESKNVIPSYATLTIKESGVTKLTQKTVFNILKNTDLRLSSILKIDEILTEEASNGKESQDFHIFFILPNNCQLLLV